MSGSVLPDDAAALREKLTEAESRIETLRRQQADAKSKAKHIIQSQREQARNTIEALQAEKEHQAQELEAVKRLLREADTQKNKISSENEEFQVLVTQGKEDLRRALAACELAESKVEATLKEKNGVEASAGEEKKGLETRIGALEQELRAERDKSGSMNVGHAGHEDQLAAKGQAKGEDSNTASLRQELEMARVEITQLQTTCDQLRKEKEYQKVASASTVEGPAPTSPADQKVGEIWLEVRQAKEEAEKLSEELHRAKEALRLKETDHEKALQNVTSENGILKQKLSSSEDQVSRLRSDLEKSEIALRAERENVEMARKAAAERAPEGDDGKKILEAKISEMERLLAAKQAEIVRVRDKAKSYLKDINAEKREMEEKMKRELETLRREVEGEQENVKLAEQRADHASTELDNCLTLIREKQKGLQMLKMTVSSEKKAAEEARGEVEKLRLEFNAYKERARVALKEKEALTSATDSAVEQATATMREEIEKTRREAQHLRKQLKGAREAESTVQELLQRAEKAEAAAELLKNETAGVPSANYSQIDALEEKAAALENDLLLARTAVEDADARHDTTKMRLEATERAMRASEVRAEEGAKLSEKTVERLRKKVNELEKELERAQESSAAAQRTAAAAAKALVFAAPTTRDRSNDTASSLQRPIGHAPNKTEGLVDEASPYDSSSGLHTERSSFAAAMEGHSDQLGLPLRTSAVHANGSLEASEADIAARDQQIAVLTTQVAELGALLDDAQQETYLKSEQTDLLKAEVKALDAKLAAAEKLQNGAPFSYLRTIVVRYLETDDATLLPVIANVLSFTEEEASRVKASRKSPQSSISGAQQKSSYFSIPFLGSR